MVTVNTSWHKSGLYSLSSEEKHECPNKSTESTHSRTPAQRQEFTGLAVFFIQSIYGRLQMSIQNAALRFPVALFSASIQMGVDPAPLPIGSSSYGG